jgi:glycosyltransferase XagB
LKAGIDMSRHGTRGKPAERQQLDQRSNDPDGAHITALLAVYGATGAEKTGAEKTGAEKTGAEKTGAEKTGAEKTGAAKPAVPTPAAAAALRRATYDLAVRQPEMSAFDQLWTWQLAATLSVVGLALGACLTAPSLVRTTVFALLAIPFAFVVVWRTAALAVVIASRSPRRRSAARTPADLPVYSVLVPLYREAETLPGLITALDRLEYPRDRLDVVLILEASDTATISAAEGLDLPVGFRLIVVPDGAPRTKPKALSYALPLARGAFIVVYDAEDTPEPQQLIDALGAFHEGGARLGCVQARLDIETRGKGWLAWQFALEYAALFHGLLPVLAAWRLPLPLGGTSNHFRRSALESSGGWDPFNVTEDADLGLRLARTGWRVGTIASGTDEEAPANLQTWIPQRTRWIKGYMQTYAVHMRRPRRLLRELGLAGFLSFQVVIGGLILSTLVMPWALAIAIADLAGGGLWRSSEDGLQRAFEELALVNLAGGYIAAIGLAAVAGARRGVHPSGFLLITMPVYWLLASFAGYRALVQIFRRPHLWEKTTHGPRPRRAAADLGPNFSSRHSFTVQPPFKRGGAQ